MKKFLINSVLLFPTVALAQGQAPAGLLIVVNRLTNFAIGIILAISVLFIIYAAFLYLTVGTNPDNVGKAKDTILYAIVGIAVALGARIIVEIAKQVFNFGGGF